MKTSIYTVVALIGLAGGAYAGTAADQLGLDKTVSAQVKAQVPAPVRVTNTAAVIKEAQTVLRNPAAFTVKQMGEVIEGLDMVRPNYSRASKEGEQLDTLRDGVDSAQRRKVREELGVREECYIGLTENSLIVKAGTSRIKALAEEVFYGRDLSSQVGEADEAGNIKGEALVWHRTKGWVTVKKYLLDGIPDSLQAIESAKDYVIAQVEKETSFKVTKSNEGICGGEGPSYLVDVVIKGVSGSVKTYGILASELSSGATGLMASDECRE